MNIVIGITAFYFGLGALLVYYIGTTKDKAQYTALWIKYIVYLLLVTGTLAAIWLEVFNAFCVALCGVALAELANLYRRGGILSPAKLAAAFIIFGLAAFALLYLGFAFTWRAHLFIYTLVFTFDGFSQLGGQLLGRKKLAPLVSPGKTMAGLFTGMAFTAFTACLLHRFAGITLVHALLFSVAACGLALAGDLAASVYKRWHGVKDYSKHIPGHGGVLDRYDSLLGASLLVFVPGMLPT